MVVSHLASNEAIDLINRSTDVADFKADIMVTKFVEEVVQRNLANLGFYCSYEYANDAKTRINGQLLLPPVPYLKGTQACLGYIMGFLENNGIGADEVENWLMYGQYFSNVRNYSFSVNKNVLTFERIDEYKRNTIFLICLIGAHTENIDPGPLEDYVRSYHINLCSAGESFNFQGPEICDDFYEFKMIDLSLRFFKNGKVKVTFPTDENALAVVEWLNSCKALADRIKRCQ